MSTTNQNNIIPFSVPSLRIGKGKFRTVIFLNERWVPLSEIQIVPEIQLDNGRFLLRLKEKE